MCKLYNTLITEISEIHRLDSVIFQRFDGGRLFPLHISYLAFVTTLFTFVCHKLFTAFAVIAPHLTPCGRIFVPANWNK